MNEIEVEEETAVERQEREDFESYLAALETFLVARPGITFTDAAEAFVLAHQTEPWMVRRMIEAVMSRVAGDCDDVLLKERCVPEHFRAIHNAIRKTKVTR